MADESRFVQFYHPGLEHEPDPSGGKGWNAHDSPLARKFIKFFGKWVEEVGSVLCSRRWPPYPSQSRLQK